MYRIILLTTPIIESPIISLPQADKTVNITMLCAGDLVMKSLQHHYSGTDTVPPDLHRASNI